MTNERQAPFPWFGGKSRAAALIWERLGEVKNYVEPFAGSLAVLLGSPRVANIETVNDLDGFIANFWRALAQHPEEVAEYADWPVNENDLSARHAWLVQRREELQSRLEGDPEFCDTKIAGWWVWGLCCWIGSGWCSGKGPWHVVDGKLVREPQHAGTGSNRVLPNLGNAGMGVSRKRPHLGNAGMGVNRQRPHLGDAGMGVHRQLPLLEWFEALATRLRRVRVCCGDWSRVLGPSPTTTLGLTGVVLDPPYDTSMRCDSCYSVDAQGLSAKVREWAIEHGDDPKMRIALCGYEGEHEMPSTWSVVSWKALGGYSNRSASGRGRANSFKERVWFSPHCLKIHVQEQEQVEEAQLSCL